MKCMQFGTSGPLRNALALNGNVVATANVV